MAITKINPVTRIAIHEAGHAFMMIHTGTPVKHVSINRKNIATGRGSQGVTVPEDGAFRMCDIAEQVVAGAVAECIVTGRDPIRVLNRITDSDEVDSICEASGISKKERPQVVRGIVRKVDRVIRRNMHKVCAIANVVEKCDKVTGAEIQMVIG